MSPRLAAQAACAVTSKCVALNSEQRHNTIAYVLHQQMRRKGAAGVGGGCGGLTLDFFSERVKISLAVN